MFDKKLYGTATVGSKGQIVIPADAREELGIEAGDKLFVIGSPAHCFIGLLKEEQMQQMLNRATDNMRSFQELVDEQGEARD